MPIRFCERPLVRQNAKMSPISATILHKYLDVLYVNVRNEMKASLHQQFDLVLDGWTSNERHFVAIMAVYNDPALEGVLEPDLALDGASQCLTRRFVLLAFCPMADVEDLCAQSLVDLIAIADTLSTFDRPWEAVLFMTGVNCSVNQSIGSGEGALSVIGCASHRFNLAMKAILDDHAFLLDQITTLMKHLHAGQP
ncbi:TPA: hypothetical protein N0F65_009845 [Lagenidium giganteum]|uniref:Transposase n=1 Tax=Lagenidium giganteum TaxID=4803 RepID=A0AAV2YNU7_9STRA|nr:TPA: hypothetical protein N0F65_009845 [Lagenidium giganteum]